MSHSSSDKIPFKKPEKPTISSHSGSEKPNQRIPEKPIASPHSGSEKPNQRIPGKPKTPSHAGSGKSNQGIEEKPMSSHLGSPGKPPRPPSPRPGSGTNSPARKPPKPPTPPHSGSQKVDPKKTQKPTSSQSSPDKPDPNSPQKTESPKSSSSGLDKAGVNDPQRKQEKPKTSHGGQFRYFNYGSPVSHLETRQGNSSCSSEISSSTSSSAPLKLPFGNIVPSGQVKSVILDYKNPRSTVLGYGNRNYGYGSVIRSIKKEPGGCPASQEETPVSLDPEELKNMGNDKYKNGDYSEAIEYYDRAIEISPSNAVYRFNKGMVFVGLMRLEESVKELEEAIRLDKGYTKARHILAFVFTCLGQVENARSHLFYPGSKPDPKQVQKCQAVETHLNKCSDARNNKDWKSVLKEVDAAVVAGADSSPQLNACKAEALLMLYSLEEANKSLPIVPEGELSNSSSYQWKFFGMLSIAYLFFVRAKIETAYGRFEDAVSLAEKAGTVDPKNAEVSLLIYNVKKASRARTRGNFFYNSERYEEARSSYTQGLSVEPSNPILLYNRAACQFKLGLYESCLDDCSQALLMQPNYTKALLKRADSNFKLERWARAVSDYEILRRELPQDNDLANNYFHAQISLKKLRGEDVSNMKFGGEVESVRGLEPLRASTSIPGVSLVYFNDSRCKNISSFIDELCKRNPTIKFLTVDVEKSREIAVAENIKIVPTFRIYRKGKLIKEMLGPSQEVLESTVTYYSL